MNGRVVQKFIQKGEEGSTAYLVADDSAANREEAAHTALGVDIWLNSGEQGKLSGPSDGSQGPAFPRFIAKIPGAYIPKGDRFTTSRDQGIAWLKELCEKAIPAPLVVGVSTWARVYKPLRAKVDAAVAAKDVDGLWRVLQEIRALPVGQAAAKVSGQSQSQAVQAFQALRTLPTAELLRRAEKVRQDIEDMRPTLGILSDDGARAYTTALEQVKFQLENAKGAKTEDEAKTYLARAVHTGEELVRRFNKQSASSILDTAAETAGKAKDAAGSALGAVWDAIPTPYKVGGGVILGLLTINALRGPTARHHEDD